jgi:peptidyl-dipeptidase A
MPDRAARRVLAAWIDRIRPAQEARARLGWEAACHATPELRARVEGASLALDRALTDPTGFAKVEQSLAERIDDPVLARAVSCLKLRLLPYRVPRPEALVTLEAGLQERFATFRADVGDRRLASHEVAAILRASTEAQELERTWRAAVRLGEEVADDVREAARLRNAHARQGGFSDYRAMKLHCEEVEAADLDGFLAELERGTDDAWRREKARLDEGLALRLGRVVETAHPWHFGDVFLQTMPPEKGRADLFAAADPVALMRRTFEGIGFDVSSVLGASDLYPREGKNQHAFCTHIDRAGDVRVLCNVVPSQRWARTMLHEFGHAAYDLYLDFDLPWNLVRPPHACVTEGVAMFFDRHVHDPRWRETIAGLAPDDTAAARARAELLTFVRWGLVMSRFEERLYADPEQDLDAVWWDLVERLQGIARPDPLPPGAWAAKIHLACFPVYYHAYLLGECVASQLGRHVREHVPGGTLVDNPEAGRWLREAVFEPSAREPWDALVERATGSPPRADALLADVLDVQPTR